MSSSNEGRSAIRRGPVVDEIRQSWFEVLHQQGVIETVLSTSCLGTSVCSALTCELGVAGSIPDRARQHC